MYNLFSFISANFKKIVSQHIWIWHIEENCSILTFIKLTPKQCWTFFTVLFFPIIAVFSQSSLHLFFLQEDYTTISSFLEESFTLLNLNGLTNNRWFFIVNYPRPLLRVPLFSEAKKKLSSRMILLKKNVIFCVFFMIVCLFLFYLL